MTIPLSKKFSNGTNLDFNSVLLHACNVINNHSLVYCDNVPSQTSTTNCSNNYFDVITDDSTLLSSGNISDITLSESRFKKKKFASI